VQVRVSDKNFCLCILFCIGMITVNSELDSASNDIHNELEINNN
jgi:hypothetical protein